MKIELKALNYNKLWNNTLNYSYFNYTTVKFTSNWWNFELTMFKLTMHFKREMIGI